MVEYEPTRPPRKDNNRNSFSLWRHQMETFSALLVVCAWNSPVTGEFTAQRPVTRSFDVFFDLRLNKRLSKQWWGWWFETSLWGHCNEKLKIVSYIWEMIMTVDHTIRWYLVKYYAMRSIIELYIQANIPGPCVLRTVSNTPLGNLLPWKLNPTSQSVFDIHRRQFWHQTPEQFVCIMEYHVIQSGV